MRTRRIILALAALYAVLLIASHLARSTRSDTAPTLPPDKRIVVLADHVTVAYRELGVRGHGDPIVLLHGSPGSSGDFTTLAPPLATRFRTLAPDLPGFGHSTSRVHDYSVREHAIWVLAMLDALDVERAHLLGFSMGGGVALEIVRQAPERVRSLTLLSAIGVQELELLGSYRLNHALHGLQLAAIWSLDNAVPHFGALDDFPLDIPYARNFYDTDQRPLRAVLERLEQPTLIVHGERDVLVPVAAAREHHRLVPQSELVVLAENHFMVFAGGAALAPRILDFLDAVEDGSAPTRAEATPQRLAAAAQPFDPAALPQATGLSLVVLMMLLAVATFASEDLASIGTGLLVAQGRVGFFAGALACFLGILIGDVAIYLAGRFLGKPWLGRAPLTWLVSESAVDRSRQWFARKGPSVIFASRFLPGTRVATYFASGVLGVGFARFIAWLALAVALWVPVIVGVASLLGVRVFELFETFSRLALPGVVALAIFSWLGFRTVKALATRRGRRSVAGRWRRWTSWEFWPPWIFYPPVLVKVAALGIRYRCLTAFTAANPAMPAGGFVGESKSAILDAIDGAYVARYRLLPADTPSADRRQRVDEFMTENDLDFPVVLKPDVGQRGSEVRIVRDDRELSDCLEGASTDLIVQEYVPGRELGVFYIRHPSDDRGRVFSITDKRLPQIVGDGSSTVEELVLADERAVAMASVYLEHLGDAGLRVPPPGEAVTLIDVGTHCRGAVFLDGAEFRTDALEAWVETVSRRYDGFFFGRYDLKAPSDDAFRRGEAITVIELNGVTSEATHIYDPKNSVFAAWKTLFRQWELAFEIGAANAADGAPVTPVTEILRMLWREWRR